MRRRLVLVLGLVLASTALASAAPVAGMLLPGEKVRDTFAPTGESRTAGFAGLAKMKCTFTAKALPRSRVQPTLAITDPEGAPTDLGKKLRSKGGLSKVTGLVLDATGVWRITVSTPADHGGGFELSAVAKAPTRVTSRATAAGDPGQGDATFDAIAGATLTSLTVTVTAKPSWTPTIELFGPDGTSLGSVAGKGSRAVLTGLALADLGRYRVAVTGGTGAFTAVAVLKPPRTSARTWEDAEARPEIESFSPVSVQNDGHVDFTLHGVGFSTQQSLRLLQGGATKYAKAVSSASQTGATVSTDLPALAPGTYDLQIGTPAGNSVVATTQLTVTNRPPGVVKVQPGLLPTGTNWDVLLTGAGFDAGVKAFVRRRSDGATIPTTILSRTSHTTLDIGVSPPDYVVGPCDLEVRDPDGSSNTVQNAIDVLGWRAAPKALTTYTGMDSDTAYGPRDAAYDPVSGRACIGIRQGASAVWVLWNTTTGKVEDTLTLAGGTGFVPSPRAAWSPVDQTWALSWASSHTTASDTGSVRIVSGSSLRTTIAQYNLVTAKEVKQVDAAADPVNGGWVVVYDSWQGPGTPGEIWAAEIPSSTPAQPATLTKVATDPLGFAAVPTIEVGEGNRFVVAYLGADDLDTRLVIRRSILDRHAAIVIGSAICAGIGTWDAIYQPELAFNPDDGTMLLTFSYLEKSTYHPACLLIGDGIGEVESLDDEGVRPEGFADSLVWNPTRKEFVIALTTLTPDGLQVTVRRVTPAGHIVASQYLQSYEGITGVLWSGPTADTLWFVRSFDGVVDGTYGSQGQMLVHGGPIR